MMKRRDVWLGVTAVAVAGAIGIYLTGTVVPPAVPDAGAAPETRAPVAPPSPPPVPPQAAAIADPPPPAPAAPAPTGPGDTPGNLLTDIRFTGGGSIVFQHEGSLRLRRSRGWIFGQIPAVDLAAYPIMVLSLKTSARGSVWLELKNAGDQGLVGQPRFDVRKLEVDVPDTKGASQRLEVDLRRDLVHAATSEARILAFSDPTEDLDIQSISFRKAGQP